MCWCRPEIRTPFCGRQECHPPQNTTALSEDEIFQAWVKAIREAEAQACQSIHDRSMSCQEAYDRALFIKLKELARDMRHACVEAMNREIADSIVKGGPGKCYTSTIQNAQLTPPRGK